MPSLTRLALRITPAPALPVCTLSLARTTIGAQGCAALRAVASSLTSLDLTFIGSSRHNQVTDAAAFLSHLHALTFLDLSLNSWVDDAACDAIAANMPRLASLTLEKTEVGDLGLASLASLAPSLTHLDCSRTSVCGTTESLAALVKMKSLRQLFLSYTDVDLQLAFHLPPSLEKLKLSRALAFDDNAIQSLASAIGSGAALRSLDLGSPGITNNAIPHLEALAAGGLQSLTLWHTTISRDGAARFRAVTGFEQDKNMASSDGTYLLHRCAAASSNHPRP